MLLDRLIRGKRRGLAAGRCCLCAAPGKHGLCAACFRDLPWNDHACRACAVPLPLLPSPVCGPCRRRPPPFDSVHAALRYAWPTNRLLHQFKFAGRLATGRVLALALAEYLALHEVPRPDLLVPVPLHRQRLAERGFNQASELARVLAPLLQVPLRHAGLRRTRATSAQSNLGRSERRRNLRGAFVCNMPVRGLHIGVVDDVVTSANTAAEIAHTLKRAGAAKVCVYAVARA